MGSDWYDAVVVGAGPAGSAAAVSLARAGVRTLLLDKAAFPRDKPCGDLLGVRALRLAQELGVDGGTLAPYQPLAGALVTASGGALDLVPSGRLGRRLIGRTDARVVPRTVFDAAMVDAAVRAGTELRQATVRRIGAWDGSGRPVEGVSAGVPMALTARVVVLTGGYGSAVLVDGPAQPAGRAEPPRGIAMRGYWRGVAAPADRIAFCLDDWVLPGYGWVFPLPNGGANVGVGTLVDAGGEREHLRALYERFTEDPASPASGWLAGATADGAARSWPLDLGPRRRALTQDGLLLAGEAAALVGPLTGAGIAFALASGQAAGAAAAAALASGDLRRTALLPYAHAVRRRFGWWLRTEGAAQRWLSDPGHVGGLVRWTRPLPPTGTVGASLLLHLG